ncbi:MAG: SDR family oxidoreductase [Hyphomonadaceae bacterium]
MAGELVLVTGGSGFIGAHCIVQLLQKGYKVRTTVRALAREPEVRAMLREAGVDAGDNLVFAAADLTKDEGWTEAVSGCAYVLHVASPFPPALPQHEDELIIPARDGALRVLKAARDAGVKRVVMTSSFAAIGYGQKPKHRAFTEEDWTDPDGDDVRAYVKSKTIAEKAAWDFIANQGGALELSVVNPVGVFGPVLGPDYSTSILLVQRLMDGAMPGLPRLCFGAVDVRDVAWMHIECMTNPAAKSQRFLAVAGDFLSVADIARILRRRLGAAAKRVPTLQIPDFMVRMAGARDPAVAQILPELGKRKNGSNEKARRLLGWTPISNEDCLVATAESLIKLGLLKDSQKKAA